MVTRKKSVLNMICFIQRHLATLYLWSRDRGPPISMETCNAGSFLDDHKEEGMSKITLPHMMVFIIVFVLWSQGLMAKVSGIPPRLRNCYTCKR